MFADTRQGEVRGGHTRQIAKILKTNHGHDQRTVADWKSSIISVVVKSILCADDDKGTQLGDSVVEGCRGWCVQYRL